MSDNWHYVEIEYDKELSPFQLGALYGRSDVKAWEGIEELMLYGEGLIDDWSESDAIALYNADYGKWIKVIRWQHETERNDNCPFSLHQIMTREQLESQA